VKRQGKLDRHIILKCFPKKLSKLVGACQKYSLPNLAHCNDVDSGCVVRKDDADWVKKTLLRRLRDVGLGKNGKRL